MKDLLLRMLGEDVELIVILGEKTWAGCAPIPGRSSR